LIESEFEFPTIVVEGSELGGRVHRGIEQRGEEHVGAEAAVMYADGPDAQRGRENGVRRTRGVTRTQLNDRVARAEPLHDLPLQRGAAAAGPHEPVALVLRI